MKLFGNDVKIAWNRQNREGAMCTCVACPIGEKVKKCGYTYILQTLVNMKISLGPSSIESI